MLIWATSQDDRLTENARNALANEDNWIVVSAASAWEIATKHRLGKLPQAQPLVEDWLDELERFGYGELPVTSEHALRAGSYHVAHGDPFDRMIAAQAELEQLAVVAKDRAFDLFPVTRLW